MLPIQGEWAVTKRSRETLNTVRGSRFLSAVHFCPAANLSLKKNNAFVSICKLTSELNLDPLKLFMFNLKSLFLHFSSTAFSPNIYKNFTGLFATHPFTSFRLKETWSIEIIYLFQIISALAFCCLGSTKFLPNIY